MDSGAPILGARKLKVSKLLAVKAVPRFYRVDDPRVHLNNFKETTGNAVGIYVHIPFCRSLCMFCPYFKDVLRDYRELEAYFKALLKEVEVYGKLLEEKNPSIVEIHVGGGTPSLVPPRLYRELADSLSQFFNVKCGISIEANPEDLRSYRAVEELYSVGIDEVSIGVQSFDERVLRSLGRKHSTEDSAKAVENSIKAGYKWVNVDLMFLAPNIRGYAELTLEEKLEAFRKDLERGHELGAHQITFYPTIIPSSSPGYRLVELGKVSQELDYVDAFIDMALDFVKDKNLYLVRVYSASRKRYEYATVNLEMVGPLIGLGAGAWGNTGLYQYVNIHDVVTYISTTEKGLPPAAYSRNLSLASRTWRLFFDQLSTAEVREDLFKFTGFKNMPLKVRFLLKAMELNGTVERVGGIYRLTRRGIKEVYKSVINYVIDVPVKATEMFTRISRSGKYPEVVEIK